MKKRSTPTADKLLVVGIPAHWGTLTPPLQHSAYGNVVLENQFEPLARRGNSGLLEPLAASSWEISPDHRVIRFKIDTNRRFSDGSHLSAADFKRSWEDGLRLKAKSKNRSVEDALYTVKGFASFAEKGTIEGIRVLAEATLELEFTEPARVSVGYLSGARYAAYKMVDGRPIGTGPYVMEEKDGALVLRPNPYYGGMEPRFQEIHIVVTPRETVREKLESGAIDAALFSEKSNLPECADGTSGKIRCVFSQEADHVAVDVNGLPGRIFSDRQHRLALQALVHQKLNEGGLPLEYRASPFSLDPQSFLKFQSGRLPDAEARKLIELGRQYIPVLAAASQQSPIYVASGGDCEWLIALLRDAGIRIAKKSGKAEFPRILEMIYKTHEPDLILGTFSVYNGDPDGLYHILGKRGAIFSPMMDREGIAELLEAGRKITEQTLLSPHYEKVARAILAQVPHVHLGYSSRGVAYNVDKTRVAESFVGRNNQRVTLFQPR